MPGAGTHLRPEIMFTDDMAASFADPDKDWEFALNADGTPKVDLLHSTIKLTFDYANLSGEYQEGEDGRAVSAGNMYRLKISGLCSAQNYTYGDKRLSRQDAARGVDQREQRLYPAALFRGYRRAENL